MKHEFKNPRSFSKLFTPYSRWYSKESRAKHNKMKVDFLEHQAKMNKFLGEKAKEENK